MFTAGPALAKSPIVIGVLDTGPGSSHEKEVTQEIRKAWATCKTCQIKTFPIYKPDGMLYEEQMLKSLDQAAKESTFLHLSWNTEYTAAYSRIVSKLNQIAESGKLIVASVGAPEGNKIRGQIQNTVMGKVKLAILIGELNEKNVLAFNTYEGPEMYKALHPPRGKRGSSFSAAVFSGRLALLLEQNPKKKPVELLSQVRDESPPN